METAEEKSSTDEKKDSDEAASEASTVVQEDGEEGEAAEGRGRPQPFDNPLLVHVSRGYATLASSSSLDFPNRKSVRF